MYLSVATEECTTCGQRYRCGLQFNQRFYEQVVSHSHHAQHSLTFLVSVRSFALAVLLSLVSALLSRFILFPALSIFVLSLLFFSLPTPSFLAFPVLPFPRHALPFNFVLRMYLHSTLTLRNPRKAHFQKNTPLQCVGFFR